MKNLLLTISTVAVLLAGQSAMALNEDSSGYELINGNSQATVAYNQPAEQIELPTASFIKQSDEANINQMEAVDFLKAENTHQ